MPERAEKRKRVYTGIIAAAALVLVLCIGAVIGGALVYGATQLSGWFSPDDSRSIIIDREEIEEGAEEPSVQTFSTGAVLVEVIEGGPAAAAGLQPDDVIVAVDGRRVGPVQDLAQRIGVYEPGDRVELTVQRSSGETSQVTVRLGENPDVSGAAYLGVRYAMSQGFRGQRQGPHTLPPMDEFELPFDMPFHGNMQGVVIAQVTADTPAARAGLEAGDLITAIDGEAVTTPDEVVTAVSQYEPGGRITLTILSLQNGEEEQVPVVLGEHPDDAGKAYLGVYLGGGMRMEGFDQGEVPERFRFFFRGQPFDWDDLPFGGDDGGRFFEFEPEFGEGNDA